MLAATASKNSRKVLISLTSLCCRDFQRKKGSIINIPEFDVFRKNEGYGFPHQCAHWFGMTLRGDFGSLRGAQRRGNPFSRPYDPPGDGRRAAEGGGPYGHTDLGVGPDAPIGPRPRPPKVRAHTEVRPYRHRRAWVYLRRGSFAWASVWLLRRRRLPHDLCVGPRPRPSSPAGSLRGAQRRGNPFSSGRRWKFIILGLHM
jgi:hypothetical protein